MVALAVDYAEITRKRATLQGAVDSAALAASAAGDNYQAVASAYLVANLAKNNLSSGIVASSVAQVTAPEGVSVALTYRQTTSFAGIIGYRTVDIGAKATALKASGARVLDVAMCIDATGSMQPTIDAVKNSALTFHQNLNAAFSNKQLQLFDSVRVRPIFYRDFGGNAATYSVAGGGKVDKYPLGYQPRPPGDSRNLGDDVSLRAASDFFNLVDQSSAFESFVSPEIESGGGDYPESGLECVNEAIDSAWLKTGQQVLTASGTRAAGEVFSVIVLWTDDDVHAPGYPPSLANANYPSTMPTTYAALEAKWKDAAKIPQGNKLFATFRRPSAPATGWAPVLQWDRYMDAGTITDGTAQVVNRIADAVATIASRPAHTRLSN